MVTIAIGQFRHLATIKLICVTTMTIYSSVPIYSGDASSEVHGTNKVDACMWFTTTFRQISFGECRVIGHKAVHHACGTNRSSTCNKFGVFAVL
jgi:hypothetical protein